MSNLGMRGFGDPKWTLSPSRISDHFGFAPNRPLTAVEPVSGPIAAGAASMAQGFDISASSPGSANTKSAWTAQIANVPVNDGALFVSEGTPGGDMLVDFSVGGQGGDVMVASDLHASNNTNSLYAGGHHILPRIPPGSTLWTRHQVISTAFGSLSGVFYFFRGSWQGLLACDKMQTFGAVTADSGGTATDPGASGGTTFGSWTLLGGPSLFNIRLLYLTIGYQSDNGRVDGRQWVDVAWSARGAPSGAPTAVIETFPPPYAGAIAQNLLMTSHGEGDHFTPFRHGPLPCNVPAGSEIWVRGASTVTGGLDRTWDTIAYGLGS